MLQGVPESKRWREGGREAEGDREWRGEGEIEEKRERETGRGEGKEGGRAGRA